MKSLKALVTCLIVGLLFTSCGEDDSPDTVMTTDDIITTDDMSENATLESDREETSASITGTDGTIYKISEATLRNSFGDFDITPNFNIQDDEFLFTQNGNNLSLRWSKGHDIEANATSVSEALLDFYRLPEDFVLSYTTESVTDLSTSSSSITFSKTSSSFAGTLQLDDNSFIDVDLAQKTSSDYKSFPVNGLSFSEIATFEAPLGFAQQGNVGFTGSYADNSMFIAHRSDCGGPEDGNGGTLRSRILKFDVDSGVLTDSYSVFGDFFTRKLNIINNNLVLMGGQRIYTYDLEISSEPIETPHNAGILSRYSTAVSGNDIYVVGGDLDEVADKVRKVNSTTGELDIIATIPTPKVHAGSEIVNDNLYIFSGREVFFDNATVSTVSYVYNLLNNTFETFNMPVALYNSYAAKVENLIYIGGDIQIDTDGDGATDDYNVWLGTYNTLDGEITEIEHNLDDSDFGSYIQQLTVFNDKLYVIYGDRFASDSAPDCPMSTWSILEADLP